MNRRIAVIGLGSVGLPLAAAFARRFPGVVGFDLDGARLAELRRGEDRHGVVGPQALHEAALELADDSSALGAADFFVIAVPTPLGGDRRPDLGHLREACRCVAAALRPGGVVVVESTVYPGVTEEVCLPLLERRSGLACDRDFGLGYSPERINPGDPEHGLEAVVKVVAARDARTAAVIEQVYGAVIPAGVHRAPSIRVAEAAKVLENTQRDVNIALMNEFAVVCRRLGLDTHDVLDAAATKWNFQRFEPGLVGGGCLSVDSHYLADVARQAGTDPELILAARRINERMGCFVARETLQLVAARQRAAVVPDGGGAPEPPRIAVLGATFKEGVPDLRGSLVPDLVEELERGGAVVQVCDPLAGREAARRQYGDRFVSRERFAPADGLVIAVAHPVFRALPVSELLAPLRSGGVLVDVKGILARKDVPRDLGFWRL